MDIWLLAAERLNLSDSFADKFSSKSEIRGRRLDVRINRKLLSHFWVTVELLLSQQFVSRVSTKWTSLQENSSEPRLKPRMASNWWTSGSIRISVQIQILLFSDNSNYLQMIEAIGFRCGSG